LTSKTFCLPFKWSITSDTLSVDFIRSGFGAFALLSIFVPDVRFFASQFAGSLGGVQNKRFKALDTFAAQVDWECLWAIT
jgi:hypothetical protein